MSRPPPLSPPADAGTLGASTRVAVSPRSAVARRTAVDHAVDGGRTGEGAAVAADAGRGGATLVSTEKGAPAVAP